MTTFRKLNLDSRDQLFPRIDRNISRGRSSSSVINKDKSKIRVTFTAKFHVSIKDPLQIPTGIEC